MKKYRKITVYFKSRQNPKIKYKVERFRNGAIFCSCPGFKFTHYNGQVCFHVKRAKHWKK